ncbi:MAG TPA: monovalent cation/H+ antiporter subunit D [bacterium]|nr:monovalent cation/H+ antiporter subunit D [bacterium]
MNHLVIAPLLLPLMMGVVLLFLGSLQRVQAVRVLSIMSMLAMLVLAIGLLLMSSDNAHRVYALGNWVAPHGIVLVLDRFSALMLVLTDVIALAALLYAVFMGEDRKGEHFHPLFMLQLFGLHGAFLTGDVFNLFVFFEVLLLASYGLLLYGGGRLRTKAGLHFVVINLVGSTLFLFAVGALYGVLGSLNLADMAERIARAPAEDHGVIAGAGLLLFAVFALKAAIFPLYLWLPQAYAQTGAAIAALFAIMTKVGLYAIVRIHGTLFGTEAGDLAGLVDPWLQWLGWITLVMAAFGVMAARFLREQISYLVIASVGMLAIGLSMGSAASLSASLYYMIHSTLLAGGFFLLADVLRRVRVQTEDRFEESYSFPRAILLGSLFFAFAVALSGMPPLSGFIGKLLILSAGMNTASYPVHLAVILITSFMIVVALARSGSTLFYRSKGDIPPELEFEQANTTTPTRAYAVIVALLLCAPLMVLFAQPLNTWLDASAQQILDHRAYIDAVMRLQAYKGTP